MFAKVDLKFLKSDIQYFHRPDFDILVIYRYNDAKVERGKMFSFIKSSEKNKQKSKLQINNKIL